MSFRPIFTGVAACFSLACGAGSRTTPPAPVPLLPAPTSSVSTSPTELEQQQPIRAGCPADDADTRVSVQELEEGGALVFTNPDDAIDLRRRVKALDLPTEEIGDPDPDKIRNGIRLVFGAEDPAKVGVLHEALRRYAEDVADRCGLSLAPPKPEPQRATRPRAGESKPAAKPAATQAAKPATAAKTPSIWGRNSVLVVR